VHVAALRGYLFALTHPSSAALLSVYNITTTNRINPAVLIPKPETLNPLPSTLHPQGPQCRRLKLRLLDADKHPHTSLTLSRTHSHALSHSLAQELLIQMPLSVSLEGRKGSLISLVSDKIKRIAIAAGPFVQPETSSLNPKARRLHLIAFNPQSIGTRCPQPPPDTL
jgi:hypothetical protein